MTRSPSLALLAAVVSLMSPAAYPAQAQFVWGANGHPLVSYPGISVKEQLDALRDLGLTSYRIDVPNSEKSGALRDLVREGKRRGITVLPVVTPAFALDKETPKVLQKKAYDLAFALVSQLKGEVPVWELGNELENYAIIQPCEMRDDGKQYNCAWGPAGGASPLDYFGPRWQKVSGVLKGLTEGAHAADPGVRRAIGTAGWGHVGAFERMKADGLSWEISVWHMYGGDPEWAFKKLAEYGRPIWVTEFNNPLGSQKGKDEQSKGLLRTMSRLSELQKTYKVEAAHIYELMDEPYWGQHYEAFMGLVEMRKNAHAQWTVGARKPAFAAVKEYIERTGARPSREPVIARHCEMSAPPPGAETLKVEAILGYAYCLVLGRAADGAGLAGWSGRLAAGMPVEQLLIEMMHSAEFSQLYDLPALSTSEHARLIHRLLLGTDPSATVLKRAMEDLNAKKPAAAFHSALIDSKAFRDQHRSLFAKLAPVVAKTVAHAGPPPKPEVRRNCDLGVLRRPLEFERGQVIYSYCLVLGRWPDGLGLKSYSADIRAGLTLNSFLLRLAQSDEFAKKYQVNALGDADFVTLLYRLLLGRDPDGAGLGAYASQLATGALGRPQVYENLIASAEFHEKHNALFTAPQRERPRASLQP